MSVGLGVSTQQALSNTNVSNVQVIQANRPGKQVFPALASAVIPGSGQMLNGETKEGVARLLGQVGLAAGTYALALSSIFSMAGSIDNVNGEATDDIAKAAGEAADDTAKAAPGVVKKAGSAVKGAGKKAIGFVKHPVVMLAGAAALGVATFALWLNGVVDAYRKSDSEIALGK